MNIEIMKLTNNDVGSFKKLIRIFEDVFEMENLEMPEDSYLQHLLEREEFMVFVALADEKIVGGLTSYILHQYYSEHELVYIYDLAIMTEFQRQGIGKKLISGIKLYCKNAGVEEIFVQADDGDDHAIDFYRSTGGIAEKVVHFNYKLNI